MAVYDPEKPEKSNEEFDPTALKEQEDDASEQPETEAEDKPKKDPDNNLQDWQDENDGEEQELKDRLRSAYDDAESRDKNEGGLFNNEGKQKGPGKLKRLLKRKKLLAGMGAGMVALVVVIGSLFSFLNVFKLDHLLQNIDSATFSRYNASFSGRSDKYVQAYIRLRLNEIEGSQDHDTLLFRANKVDTNNPVRDWYRTLRTGKFEKEVFESKGITFQSIAIQDATGAVTLRPAMVDFRDRPELHQEFRASVGSKTYKSVGQLDTDLGNFMSGLDLDSKNSVLKVFDNDKQARKEIKKAVNDSTRFFQVLKRRHTRKDIQNMTGISSWKFFETTRNKYTASKVRLQQKIIKKVLPENNAGKFIKCILGAANCVASTDPAAPENQAGNNAAGKALSPDESDQTPTEQVNADGSTPTTVDADGNTIVPTDGSFNPSNTADDVIDAIDGVAVDELDNEVGDIVLSPAQKLVADQVKTLVGGNVYTKAWSWAKKIAKIHNNIVNHKFSKIVKQARLVQLAAIYATYEIARDQSKSGQLTSEEMNNLMGTLSDAQHNQGWQSLNNKAGANATTNPPSKEQTTYCGMTETEKKKQNVQYFCDQPSSNRALAIETAYQNSPAYPLLSTIADAVNEVNDSIIGKAINKIISFADTIMSKLTDPIISKFLSATGLQDKLQRAIGTGMNYILTFMGAGPIFDGTQAGALNFILAGSSATAEGSARDSGAVASTPTTVAYTNSLAAAYEKDQAQSKSMFEKFASLDNPSSLASTTLYGASTFNIGNRLSSFMSSVSNTFASLFSGRTFAATNNFDTAEWAGVDKYDIPPVCQALDPLDPDYVTKAVGVVSDSPFNTEAQAIVTKIQPSLTIEKERDGQVFWKLVYDTISNPDTSEDISGAIYNCAIFDSRVMGSMGYTSGFSNDNGLDEGGSTITSTPSTPSGLNITGLNGYTIPCTGQPRQVVRKTPAYPSADWTGIPDSGTIGRTSAGQPIKVYIRQACDTTNVKTIVIVSSIHGSENGGQLISHELLFNASLPANVRIIAIPELNGSSIGIGRRKNNNGVDLNRNNDYLWDTLKESDETTPSGMFYKGTSVASEPETQAVNAFLTSLGKVNVSIHYHDNLTYVSAVGSTPNNLAVLYGSLSGLPVGNGREQKVTQRGSLDGWYNSKFGTPALLVEMASNQSEAVIQKHVDAVKALATSGEL